MTNQELLDGAIEFHKRLVEANQSASIQGTHIQAGNHSFVVQTNIETTAQKNGKFLVGLVVDIELDGKPVPTLRYGAVGIGQTQAEAIQFAAEEYSLLMGRLLIQALFAPSAHFGITGRYALYSSGPGLRGQQTIEPFKSFLPHLYAAMLKICENDTEKNFSPTIHSALVIAALHANGAFDCKCWTDGKENPQLSAAIARLPWPKGQVDCLYKQFFLFYPRAE